MFYVGALLLVGLGPRNPDHYRMQIFAAFLFLAFLYAKEIWNTTRTGAALWMWCAASSIYVFTCPRGIYFTMIAACVSEAFQNNAAQSLIALLLVPQVALYYRQFRKAFFWLAIANSIFIICHPANAGILDNASLDGCLLVCSLPMVIRKSKEIAILCAFSILVTGASTPIIALGLFATFHFRKWWIPFVAGFAGLLAIGSMNTLVDPNGRQFIWRSAWNFLTHNVPMALGTGTGTFNLWGPTLPAPYIYIWLHNDWFQLLFEQGWIGLVLGVIFYLDSFKKGHNKLEMFLFGFIACTEMPLRHTLFAMLGVLIFVKAQQKRFD